MRKQTLLVTIIITCVLLRCNDTCSQKWKSTNFDFEVEYSDSWSLIFPPIDTKERILFGVIDESDGKFYLAEITKMSLYKDLTDEEYFEESKKRYISEHRGNKFLKAEEMEFHNETYHVMSFIINNPKWGLSKMYDFVKRDDNLVIGIVLSFPVDSLNADSIQIPDEILNLDRNIKINGN